MRPGEDCERLEFFPFMMKQDWWCLVVVKNDTKPKTLHEQSTINEIRTLMPVLANHTAWVTEVARRARDLRSKDLNPVPSLTALSAAAFGRDLMASTDPNDVVTAYTCIPASLRL